MPPFSFGIGKFYNQSPFSHFCVSVSEFSVIWLRDIALTLFVVLFSVNLAIACVLEWLALSAKDFVSEHLFALGDWETTSLLFVIGLHVNLHWEVVLPCAMFCTEMISSLRLCISPGLFRFLSEVKGMASDLVASAACRVDLKRKIPKLLGESKIFR